MSVTESADRVGQTAAVEGSGSTAGLLLAGAVAGPLWLVVALLQVATREGFDLTRHPLSMLSLGSLGWIQIANFVVAGPLFGPSAVGMRRVLQPGRAGTWGPPASVARRAGPGGKR